MKALLLLIIIFLAACGKNIDKSNYFENEKFEEIYNEFLNEGYKRGVYLSPKYLSIETGENLGGFGFCNQRTEYVKDKETLITTHVNIKTIVIDKILFNIYSDAELKYLLFHELGHCLLSLEHDNTINENNPSSIMHEEFNIVIQFYENVYSYDYYVDELFNKYLEGKGAIYE